MPLTAKKFGVGRLWPSAFAKVIDFGTAQYSDEIARRLRAVNIAAWPTAAPMFVFVLKKPEHDPATVAMASILLLAPLLHRFGSVAAALLVVLVLYVQAYRITMSFGMGNGAYLSFLTVPAASVLLLGIERLYLRLLTNPWR